MTPDYQAAIEAMKAMVGWVGSLVTLRQSNNREREGQVTAALISLMDAARETRHYLAQLRVQPELKNDDIEQELAKQWAKAGIDMSYIDSRLAGLYLMKADYWSDTDGWSEAEKDDALIQLDEMIFRGQQVLLA